MLALLAYMISKDETEETRERVRYQGRYRGNEAWYHKGPEGRRGRGGDAHGGNGDNGRGCYALDVGIDELSGGAENANNAFVRLSGGFRTREVEETVRAMSYAVRRRRREKLGLATAKTTESEKYLETQLL